MFTKAIAKALVMVLTVGMTSLFSSSSSAITQADSLTLSAATSTQQLGETATVGAATTTVAYLGERPGDTYSVVASLVSAPAGNTSFPVLRLIETTAAMVFETDPTNPFSLFTVVNANTQVRISPRAIGAAVISAKFQVYMNAPSKNGTYVVRITPSVLGGGGTANATAQTLTITVGVVTPTPEPTVTPAPTDISQLTAPTETSTSETYTTSFNLSRTLAGQLTSKSQTQNEVLINMKLNSNSLSDTATIQSYLVSAPAGNTTYPVLEYVQVTNGRVNTGTPVLTSVSSGLAKSNNPFYLVGLATPTTAQAQFNLYLESPKKAGVYVIRIMTGIAGGSGVAPNGLTVIILVTKDPETYPTRAEVVVSKPGEITNKSDAEIFASGEVDLTNEVAVIRTTMRSSSGAVAVLDSYTAILTGPGLLGSAPLSLDINTSTVGRAIYVRSGDAVTVYADGNYGVATVIIQTFDGTEVGRKYINFINLSNQASAILALSFSSFPEKGSLVTLTGLVNLPGTVRFTNNGKTLGSCARVVATGSPRTAVCQWKPPISGSVNIVARFTPTDQGISAVSTTKVLAIGRRSGKR